MAFLSVRPGAGGRDVLLRKIAYNASGENGGRCLREGGHPPVSVLTAKDARFLPRCREQASCPVKHLHAPRPQRRANAMARILSAMEIPECDCWDPDDVGPPPLCEHVLAAEHGLSVHDWARLLLAFDPKGYGDPPPPPEPARVLSKDARIALYRLRASRGYALYHPHDLDPAAIEGVAVQAEKGLRQGNLKKEHG